MFLLILCGVAAVYWAVFAAANVVAERCEPEPVRTDPGAEARRAFEASARPGSPDTSEDYWPGAA